MILYQPKVEYIYVNGPMSTSPGIICNYLVLGLLFQRFRPNECTIVHSTGGRNELAFGVSAQKARTLRRGLSKV